jgi:hypothetical protein
MKQLITILISTIYLLLSTGLVINVHYCQDKLKSFSIITEPEKCSCASMDAISSCCAPANHIESCCSGGKQKSNCCTDEQIVIQMIEYQQKNTPIPELSKLNFIIIRSILGIFEEEYSNQVDISFTFDLPPPKTAFWKLNCQFVFYG